MLLNTVNQVLINSTAAICLVCVSEHIKVYLVGHAGLSMTFAELRAASSAPTMAGAPQASVQVCLA